VVIERRQKEQRALRALLESALKELEDELKADDLDGVELEDKLNILNY